MGTWRSLPSRFTLVVCTRGRERKSQSVGQLVSWSANSRKKGCRPSPNTHLHDVPTRVLPKHSRHDARPGNLAHTGDRGEPRARVADEVPTRARGRLDDAHRREVGKVPPSARALEQALWGRRGPLLPSPSKIRRAGQSELWGVRHRSLWLQLNRWKDGELNVSLWDGDGNAMRLGHGNGSRGPGMPAAHR